ncbi:hypothetical protein DFH27DRAFT_613641 [Peziza echinospora]|nr:hypothetical protein DFH27DRAFT_613641 [Peziza echinospora]
MPPLAARAFASLSLPVAARRSLATAAHTPPPAANIRRPNPAMQVFSRKTKLLQRTRSVLDPDASRRVDYLKAEVAQRLVDKLMDITRPFNNVLDIGAGACHFAKAYAEYVAPPPDDPTTTTLPPPTPTASKIQTLYCTETSTPLLHRDQNLTPFTPPHPNLPTLHLLSPIDEENLLSDLPPTLPKFDAIVSSLSLHWVNDLPYFLSSIPSLLAPDSPFIAAMLGGDTLFELRTSLQLAEQERRGGVSPHVSPLADTKDVASLLQSAGLKMLTIDVDDIVILYPDIFSLMKDIQQMGEGNAVLGREQGPIGRDVLMAAEGIYRELHGEDVSDVEVEEMGMQKGDKVLPATFRVIYMIGWSEGPNQPKPLKRGSGQVSMKDILSGDKKF